MYFLDAAVKSSPMSSDVIISASGLGKTYYAYAHPMHRLLARLSGGRIGSRQEFKALEDIRFEVLKGEAIGIMGRNGSGKSTLLQIIGGIRQPSRGSISVHGRISALLELGSGFHPDYTGRENVFLQGAIVGMDAETMADRLDDILGFADIGGYIDQPVHTYSSGMFLRLAFAVAASVDPDVLIVDEALAVGDAQFQRRCFARLQELRDKKTTLLFVSHDQEMIRTLTDRALVLDRGRQVFFGDTREANHFYRKLIFEDEALRMAPLAEKKLPEKRRTETEEAAYGIGGARIVDIRLLDGRGKPVIVLEPRARLRIEIAVAIEVPLDHLNIGVVIRTVQGVKVYSWGTLNQDMAVWAGQQARPIFWEKRFSADELVVVNLNLDCSLGAGNYEVQAVVSRELNRDYSAQQILHWRDEAAYFRVATDSKNFFGGLCDLRGTAQFD